MSKIGKRTWKKVTLAILLSIFLGIFSSYSLANGEEADFQKIRLTPTDVSWELDDEVIAGKSIFIITLDVTISNLNSDSFEIVYPTTLIQMVGTKAEMILENDTEASLYCSCASFETAMDYRQINPGTTTNQSTSALTIQEEGLTDLPDGNYTFSAYLYNVEESKFISDNIFLEMKDGIPNIYTTGRLQLSIGIPKSVIISSVFIIFIIFNLRKSKKE